MNFDTLQGAYGRDYKSRAAVLEDWNKGLDFQCVWCHRYCSKRDFERDITVRYKNNTRVTILKYRVALGTWQ